MPRITKKTKSMIDLIQDFLDYCNYKNLSIKTIKSYNQTLILFMRYPKKEKEIIDIRKVNKEIVKEYIQFTKERGKYSFVASKDGMIKANIYKRTDMVERYQKLLY